MRNLTVSETAQWLLARDRFAILTHRRPDGDTLGSAAALCLGLRSLGKTAHILYNPEVTPRYAHLQEDISKETFTQGDTLVCVDVAATDLIPEGYRHLTDNIDLRIDHHRASESFTKEEFVDPLAAACGQLIYDILMEMGVVLDRPMANAIHIAISTDTGCFRFGNTQSHTLEVAAACAKVSDDLSEINRNLFTVRSFRRMKLEAWIVEHLRLEAEGKIAVCALPLAVEQAMELTEDDMENISGFLRSIEGVCIGAMLRENWDGTVKLSVRCHRSYNAGGICAQFGGGGHVGAAGATLNMPMDEAVKAVCAAMPTV